MTKRWRDVLQIHPAAELFPLMTPDELRVLGEDIKRRGGVPAISPVLWEAEKGAPLLLLDGRNRLDAMEMVGLPVLDAQGEWLNWNLDQRCIRVCGDDPYAIVITANIHRRHLTAEQKRDLLAKLIKAQPEKSDRRIGKMARASKNTAAAVRREMEGRGQIDHVEKRKDTKGRAQPSSKPRKAGKLAKGGEPHHQKRKATGTTGDPVGQSLADQGIDKHLAEQRDDIAPTSAGELARRDAELEELRAAKRQLEIKIAGLESEVEELRGKLATGTGGDMSISEFQTAIKKWEETVETQRSIIARLENENAKLRAGVAAPPADDGLDIPECLKRSAS
jgi:hypothetical protein